MATAGRVNIMTRSKQLIFVTFSFPREVKQASLHSLQHYRQQQQAASKQHEHIPIQLLSLVRKQPSFFTIINRVFRKCSSNPKPLIIQNLKLFIQNQSPISPSLHVLNLSPNIFPIDFQSHFLIYFFIFYPIIPVILRSFTEISKCQDIISDLTMALLVDDQYFLHKFHKIKMSTNQTATETFITELAHSIIPNNSFYIRQKTQKNIVAIKNLRVSGKQYQMKLTISTVRFTLKIDISQLQQSTYRQIRSKGKRIRMLKQIAKLHRDMVNQGNFYINGGRVILAIRFNLERMFGMDKNNNMHKLILSNLSKITLLYNKLDHMFYSDCLGDYEKQLQISQIISTTTGYFDVFSQTSQFLMASENYKKQKESVQRIIDNTIDQPVIEKITNFGYQAFKKSCIPRWIRQNLIACEEQLQKKGRKLLLSMLRTEDKMLEDFIYNLVKIQVLQKSKKPIAEGGSSLIYISRVLITYINSVDSTIIQNSKMKVQRVVVMKSIKPGLQQIMKGKLKHQTNITGKMKGSCCCFIPKYYGTEQKSEFNNEIIMEYIQGEELDKYIEKRCQTISFSTKILLLSNIYYGFRHLVTYKIIHLDLKPINIMVSRQLLIKIIDFGEAYNQQICKQNYCPGYTFPYAAPQVYSRYEDNMQGRNQKYLYFSEKQDVYAFGIIMFQLLFSRPLFEMQSQTFKKVYYQRTIYERVMSCFERIEDYGDNFTMSILLRVIMQCLHPDPEKRPFFDWIGLSLKLILYSHICQ